MFGIKGCLMLTLPLFRRLMGTQPFGSAPYWGSACGLPLWASLVLGHLQEWVHGWVLMSVFSLGNGVSSVEACLLPWILRRCLP